MVRLGAQERVTAWAAPPRDGPGAARSPEVLLPRVAALLPAGSPVAIRVGPNGFGVFATRDIRLGPNGVGVFATRDIARGEDVMVDRLVVAVHSDRTRCHHCLGDGAAVRCASPCRLLFCSSACKAAAHAQYHAPLCGADTRELDELVTAGMTSSSRFPLLAASCWAWQFRSATAPARRSCRAARRTCRR
jgi:hypothetical protein